MIAHVDCNNFYALCEKLFDPTLEGVPVAIKDSCEVAGDLTTHGSKVYANHRPDRTHPGVARLLEAGAILVARTTMPEFGVVGQRLVYELRGSPCHALELEPPNKKSICCSRSFGRVTRDFEPLREATATFAALAAAKLRAQGLAAGMISVFVQTDRHDERIAQYANRASLRLPTATADTRTLIAAARRALQAVHRPQHACKRAGVMLDELTPESRVQPGLFDKTDRRRSARLMQTLDRDTLRVAAAADWSLPVGRTVDWRGRCEKRSPRYTTDWREIPVAG